MPTPLNHSQFMGMSQKERFQHFGIDGSEYGQYFQPYDQRGEDLLRNQYGIRQEGLSEEMGALDTRRDFARQEYQQGQTQIGNQRDFLQDQRGLNQRTLQGQTGDSLLSSALQQRNALGQSGFANHGGVNRMGAFNRQQVKRQYGNQLRDLQLQHNRGLQRLAESRDALDLSHKRSMFGLDQREASLENQASLLDATLQRQIYGLQKDHEEDFYDTLMRLEEQGAEFDPSDFQYGGAHWDYGEHSTVPTGTHGGTMTPEERALWEGSLPDYV